MCIHTYIRKPEEIQAEAKEKSRISKIHKKKKNEEEKDREVLQFQMQFLGRPPSTAIRPIELSKRRGDTVKQFARIAGPILSLLARGYLTVSHYRD